MARFKKVYIEITNICNLRCSFCSINKSPVGYMSPVFFAHVIEKVKDYTNYIYLHVKGEPLLHPQLDEILDICHFNNMKVVLVTNGTLLKQKEDMLLRKQALQQVNISLHCYTELKQLMSKEEYLYQVFQFIRKALDDSKLYVSLKLWNYSRYSSNMFTDNSQILDYLEREFAPGFEIKSIFKAGSRIKLAERLYLNSDFEFVWPDLSNDFLNTTGYCHALRDHIAVLTDGTVVPCCLDANGINKIGDMKTNTVQEILESARARDMYNGFTNKTLTETLCQKCGFIFKFSAKI